jgi:cystathionine beta-lyase
VVWETYDDLIAHRGRYTYGRRGTPTTDALADALRQFEGGAGVMLTPSGLSAITTALLAVVKSGDHVLITDSVYRPTRVFADSELSRLGIEVEYFGPLIGAGIDRLFRKNTSAVFLEAPGSQSFEMQDIRAISKVARERGAITLADNTWATPLYFRPHEHGVDISIQAGTKYLGGHAESSRHDFGYRAAPQKVQDTRQSRHQSGAGRRVSGAARPAHYGVRLARHMQPGALARSAARCAYFIPPKYPGHAI